VHRNQVSLIESGSRLPRFDTLLKLAAALEVDLDVLSHGITYKPRLLSAAPGEFEISSRSLFDEVGAADRPTRGTNR
jgi:transcriptional regulator with XRE-family HTH domain